MKPGEKTNTTPVGAAWTVQYGTTRGLTTTAPTHTAAAVPTIRKINGGVKYSSVIIKP